MTQCLCTVHIVSFLHLQLNGEPYLPSPHNLQHLQVIRLIKQALQHLQQFSEHDLYY